jgi:glutathione S-transferase
MTDHVQSGAIVEYLLETYDKSKSLHYTSSPDKFITQQWLHFQTSGQQSHILLYLGSN